MFRSIRFLTPVLALGLVAVVSQALVAADAPAQGTATITGIVTDADQKPVANAAVTLQKADQPAADQAAPEAKRAAHARVKYTTVARTKSGEDGKFTFSNLAAGEYRVVASDKTAGMGASKPVKVEANQSQDVSIALKVRAKKAH
jgi:hypothetical protein